MYHPHIWYTYIIHIHDSTYIISTHIWFTDMVHRYGSQIWSQVRKMTFIWYTYMIIIYDTHMIDKKITSTRDSVHMIHIYGCHICFSYIRSKVYRSFNQENVFTYIWLSYACPIYNTHIWTTNDHKYERWHSYDTHIWLSYNFNLPSIILWRNCRSPFNWSTDTAGSVVIRSKNKK